MSDERVYSKIEKLEEKFDSRMDKFETQMDEVTRHLLVYNNELTRHIEGVKLAREENKMLKVFIEKETEKIEDKIAPIQKHVDSVKIGISLTMKVGALILALLGAALTLKQLGLF